MDHNLPDLVEIKVKTLGFFINNHLWSTLRGAYKLTKVVRKLIVMVKEGMTHDQASHWVLMVTSLSMQTRLKDRSTNFFEDDKFKEKKLHKENWC